mmetsp:Transcript_29044/g.53375  ORF Transcript_29044/g.53375 Transcript_29044/m.53375 type:complete len:356 (-) Transcript_29044:838-1905(-)|eukprot:CAMPEP_0175057264 /NCGR_PEP_ID=MMETSP0052_2-20121109/11163_1 /TAXON_ID=51329 ORGANISM="Polytomella parva, Strain SAG 63-3" /NCGR_SAMPLE_ID=MMETSP0052_2 /ASSEMBLY_ACC=CAM_ASM_000194 /LENGTH=355 /DNA_ID=CAMNT_0016322449 /DNA_START=114 /DNA_END=1181 /DNA_ORIENTATION=-
MFGSTQKTPYTEPEWKIPGYTGYIQGIQETYKKTPVMAQLETKAPEPDSFLYTRTAVPPKPTPSRDPCNNPEALRKAIPGNLWPALQASAVQPSFKPPMSMVNLGDERVNPFVTSYHVDFKAPFEGHEQLRSPNRNEDLVKTTASLKDIYKSCYNRVGEKRLQKMISTMRERMEAKLGNSNNNAFRTRKLFKMYDTEQTGKVHFENFRNMCETFGMQLDDDNLMALFYVYDPQGTGFLEYESLVQQLLSPSDFAFYLGYVDNSQGMVDEQRRQQIIEQLGKKLSPVLPQLEQVLAAFDGEGRGFLSRRDLMGGCAAVGLVLSEPEYKALEPVLKLDDQGHIHYAEFCALFKEKSA